MEEETSKEKAISGNQGNKSELEKHSGCLYRLFAGISKVRSKEKITAAGKKKESEDNRNTDAIFAGGKEAVIIQGENETNMKDVLIVRTDKVNGKETLGYIFVFDGRDKTFECVCLELPFKDNQKNISSIPVGEYDLKLEWSPRFSMMLWEIYGVQGRGECKFHSANYVRQLNGCVAPGLYFKDLDGDGLPDVASSYQTLMKFHDAMGRSNEAKLKVIDLY